MPACDSARLLWRSTTELLVTMLELDVESRCKEENVSERRTEQQ